jgi:hypothetical protein
MLRIVKLALLVTLVLSSSSFLLAQSLPTTVVAYTGQAIDGGLGIYGTLGAFPRLGPNGHVAFSSFFAGAPTPDDFGYFVGLPGALQVAIRENADEGGPELFDGNGNVGVDANGKISVWTTLAAPTPANQRQVLYGQMPGGTEIARQGITVAPGFGGGSFSTVVSSQATNDAGEVAFVGSVTGGDAVLNVSDLGLFTGSAGDLSLVARKGSAAPTAMGTTPVFSTFFDKRINNTGQVGFAAGLSGAGVSATNDRTIYVWTPGEGGAGTLALAAQTGSPAPGIPPIVNFSQIDEIPDFNDMGEVAIRGQLIGDGVISSNNSGIWAGAPGDVQLVMRAGNPSPLAGITFRSPQPGPRINDNGYVAFFSSISGTGVTTSNDTALWATTSEGIQLVAREGIQAPGTAAGTIFGLSDTLLAFNDLGQVAFTSPISGGGSSAANNRGLWAGAPGELQLIAREGDVIDLDPGPGELLKTISGNNGISFGFGMNSPFNNDSASAAFNDDGQIAWRATFTDATTAILLTTLPGTDPNADFDDDGDIDGRDFLIWQRGFGLTGQNDNTLGDADFSGTIDGDDLIVWQDQYGGAPPLAAAAAVPEPAVILLLLPGVFAILTRRCGIKS